jgi:hypothetical protein
LERDIYRAIEPGLKKELGEEVGERAAVAVIREILGSGGIVVVRRSMLHYLVEVLGRHGRRTWAKRWPQKPRLTFVAAKKILARVDT